VVARFTAYARERHFALAFLAKKSKKLLTAQKKCDKMGTV
jgi:hypothetical protein